MSNFAQELQVFIDQRKAWEALNTVEKAVDIFIKEMKKDLLSQAKRGIEIDDMIYVAGGNTFDNVYSAFRQVKTSDFFPTDRQIQKFKAVLGIKLIQEGLKYELRRDDRTGIVTMKFTVYVSDV